MLNFTKICHCWSMSIHATHVNVSRNAFFSSRSEKNIFFDVHTVWSKTNRNLVYRGLYYYRQRVHIITLFPNNFFFLLLLHVERVCKSFWKKVWRVQIAHLHNAARALSSRSRCFQLSTNLDKDWCLSLSLILW